LATTVQDTAPTTPSKAPRRTALRAGLVAAGLVPFFLWEVGVLGGNVRTVVPGRVFRSAQLKGAALGELLDRERIRTVISLRGGSPDDASELDACARRGVTHVDIPLSASALPPPDRLEKLLDSFDHAQYPLLFHCQGGADRSGLAGTLYLALYEHVPLDEAEARQLTWRYAHVKWGAAHAMDEFFDLYRQTSGGLDLRRWIRTVYPGLYNRPTGTSDTTPARLPAQATAVR
jgi:protein tyrosine phosphatase (PTP) superfamily phosphohydrolase (DUF442 family)